MADTLSQKPVPTERRTPKTTLKSDASTERSDSWAEVEAYRKKHSGKYPFLSDE